MRLLIAANGVLVADKTGAAFDGRERFLIPAAHSMTKTNRECKGAERERTGR